MENVTKIETTEKKPNIFKRGYEAWKKANEEHPVRTKILTGATIVGTIATTVGVVYLVKKSNVAKANLVSDVASALPSGESGFGDYDVTNLPAELGFDCVKVVNKSGDILVESIVDMGNDYEVAGDLNAKNIIKEIGDMDLVKSLADEIISEASVVADAAETVVDTAI